MGRQQKWGMELKCIITTTISTPSQSRICAPSRFPPPSHCCALPHLLLPLLLPYLVGGRKADNMGRNASFQHPGIKLISVLLVGALWLLFKNACSTAGQSPQNWVVRCTIFFIASTDKENVTNLNFDYPNNKGRSVEGSELSCLIAEVWSWWPSVRWFYELLSYLNSLHLPHGLMSLWSTVISSPFDP